MGKVLSHIISLSMCIVKVNVIFYTLYLYKNKTDYEMRFNPFPHIDAFWCFCSRGLFENIVIKENIAQNKQFLLLTQCFPLLVIGYPFNYRKIVVISSERNSHATKRFYRFEVRNKHAGDHRHMQSKFGNYEHVQ